MFFLDFSRAHFAGSLSQKIAKYQIIKKILGVYISTAKYYNVKFAQLHNI